MSEQRFVYPQHAMFEPYRELAESTELLVKTHNPANPQAQFVAYERVDVPYEMAYSHVGWNLKNAPAHTLEPGAARDSFWRNSGGIDTLSHYKQWRRPYVNHGQRLARYGDGSAPQAQEILSHGVGTLRYFKDKATGIYEALGTHSLRIDSVQTQRLGTYIVDVDTEQDGKWVKAPFGLESTNLVMPEIVGELTQLSARRDETDLMQAYLNDLLRTASRVSPQPHSAASDRPLAPDVFKHMKARWRAAHLGHLSTGLWAELPGDTSELVDRVDEVLGRIDFDSVPTEVAF